MLFNHSKGKCLCTKMKDLKAIISSVRNFVTGRKRKPKNLKALKKVISTIRQCAYISPANQSLAYMMMHEETLAENTCPWLHFAHDGYPTPTTPSTKLMESIQEDEPHYESLNSLEEKNFNRRQNFPEENSYVNSTKLKRRGLIFPDDYENSYEIPTSTPLPPALPEEDDSQSLYAEEDFTYSSIDTDNIDELLDPPTPTKDNEVLTTSIIRELNTAPADLPDLCLNTCPTCGEKPSSTSSNDKFVVNLFESRPSKKWKRKSFVESLQTPFRTVVSAPKEVISDDNNLNNYVPYNNDVVYQQLKTERDMECIKLNEASNALRAIRANRRCHQDFSEELVAERILLESGLKVKLLVNKIRDLGYSEVKNANPKHTGTISLSDFKFTLESLDVPSTTHEEFYVLVAVCGTQVKLSKTLLASTDGSMTFEEGFLFEKIDAGFNIHLQLMRIQFERNPKTIFSSLRKKSKWNCNTSKIYYENHNTCELKENKVLQTRFVPVKELILKKVHLKRPSLPTTNWEFTPLEDNSRIKNFASFGLYTEHLIFESNLSGFMTFGRIIKNYFYWERKWCVLKDTKVHIYNYPQEEFMRQPLETINLEYSLGPITCNSTTCPRNKTFVLTAGRPRTYNDAKRVPPLKTHGPNYVEEKYFFNADNLELFKKWSGEIASILDSLKDWNRLVLLNDSY